MNNKTELRNKTKEYFGKGVKVTEEGVFWTNEETLFSYLLNDQEELKVQASNKKYIEADYTTLTEKDIQLLYDLKRINKPKKENPIFKILEEAEKESDQILDQWSNLCSMKEI